jgi:hypothetical protein
VVDVARLGQPHHRVDEEVGLDLLGRPQGDLLVGPVHRVAGLEGDHLRPPQLVELRPDLGRCLAQGPEVVVQGQLGALQPAGQVHRVGAVQQVPDAGVLRVGGAEHSLGLGVPVGPVELGHVDGGEDHALGVAQHDRRPGGDTGGELLGHVQRDGHGPQGPVGQAHLVADRPVVGLTEEPRQGREGPVEEELEVAGLAGGEVPRLPVGRR